MRPILLLLASILFFGTSLTPGHTQLAQCDEARNKAVQAVNSTYAETISDIDRMIQQAKDNGYDPRKFPYFDKDNNLHTVDLIAAKDDLLSRRGADQKAVSDKVNAECDKQLQPIQDIVDASVAIATLGLSEVLPKHFTHIDTSEIIIGGKPLGGDNALIPKARDDILDGLGVGGTGRKIIVDPVGAIKDLF